MNAQSRTFYYLAQRTRAARGFDFSVEARFESAPALIDHVLSGAWLQGWAGGQQEIFAAALYIVAATVAVAPGKSLPNRSVSGYNLLTESKHPAVRAAAAAALSA